MAFIFTTQMSSSPLRVSVTSPLLLETESPTRMYPPSEVCWTQQPLSAPLPPSNRSHWIAPAPETLTIQ